PISPTPSTPENPTNSPTPPIQQPTPISPTPDNTSEQIPSPQPSNPSPQQTPTTGDSETPTDNSAGDTSEPTTGNSVRVTLASVMGASAYEGSCAYSANGNFTICPTTSIVSPSPDGQCNGQFSIEALIDDSASSQGKILEFNRVRGANGENAPVSCSIWIENLIRDWRFQPDENSEYFTDALIDISIAIDVP
ncbi:hypothetical protein IQ235_04630, partial [Oscillatoriales cyanobacterium LEGE 11467]|nr:hypothetical protein [Zarconia navalis LEGE 11467]